MMCVGAWFQAYENLQFLAVILIYAQVGCSLIGSLGVSYIGLLLANLTICLFALVAIESRSQGLTRTYAALLTSSLFLDIIWFSLFSAEIRRYTHEAQVGKFTAFSLEIVFLMQVLGFIVRCLSGFVWFQMYRMGLEDQSQYTILPGEGNFGRVGTFRLFSPMFTPRTSRQVSLNDEVLGGSIYYPRCYSSHFSSIDENRPVKKKESGNLDEELEQGISA
ncbi:hypothetical protein KP509_18G043100 [Ceratopteris richardii]|uniref:Uncharacterized protein n=1 Tax=Ceratopteris richardii TaxID=49495 RepID=A0A8T2SP35_CERRI|nr:hypothetical protein KP509_18G043100 [Ceratopteris richardii]